MRADRHRSRYPHAGLNLGDAKIIPGNFVITSRAHAATPQLGSPGKPPLLGLFF